MAYKHGTYGEFEKSIGSTPVQSGTVPVYVGVSPVNLVSNYAEKGVVNAPVKVANIAEARANLGYSDDWETFDLCEAIAVHFENTLGNAGPVVFINVLDPKKHVNAQEVTGELDFATGSAMIKSDKIIIDTLVLADKVKGVDFTAEYDFAKGAVVISAIDDSMTGKIQATYKEVDASAITNVDVIGGVTEGGVYTGLGCIGLVYPELGLITNIIAAPGYSYMPDIYKAMVLAGTKINGHWDAFVNADLEIAGTDTMQKAIQWKSDHDYTSERAKVYWPQWQAKDGRVYHLSTLATWLMMGTDAGNYDIPMESPSNKQIINGNQYFGASSTNKGYDQQQCNTLNANGITTAVYWGGINVLWGPHTAAYNAESVTDKRNIFDNSLRTMMHITNSFQQEHALTIDSPMTRAMADTIKNREQEKADAMASMGGLIGKPVVEFKEFENSANNLAQGDFTWSFEGTPTPPFKSGTLKVAYTDAGFASFLEGGE